MVASALVVGYALKEEFFNEAYPAGVENVAYDFDQRPQLPDLHSHRQAQGLSLERQVAPWRARAAPTPPGTRSAASPTSMGRLIWSAVGDPAMIAFPDNASWMPNRVQSEVTKVVGQSGGIKVPADALRPQPGSGHAAARRRQGGQLGEGRL